MQHCSADRMKEQSAIIERDMIMRQYKKLFAILTLVCFALTLMPMTAFATVPVNIDYQESSVFTKDKDAEEKTGEDLTVQFHFVDKSGHTVDQATGSVYVWFVKEGSSVAATAVSMGNIKPDDNGVFEIKNPKTNSDYKFQFSNSGNYTVRGAFSNPSLVGGDKTLTEKFSNVENKLDTVSGQYQFAITARTASDEYQLQLVDNAGLVFTSDANGFVSLNKELKNGEFAYIGAGLNLFTETGVNKHLDPNGVASDDITFRLLDKAGKPVKGVDVKLSTSSTNIEVNKEKVTTDQLGQFKFKLTLNEESPNTDGYTVYIESGEFTVKLYVTSSSTGAQNFVFAKYVLDAPISTEDASKGKVLDDYIWIKVNDANGNTVKPFALQPGGKYAEPAFAGVTCDALKGSYTSTNYKNTEWGDSAENFVSVVSKPAGSDLENEDIWLTPVGKDALFQNTIYLNEDLIPGDYTIKISLASGFSKTISFKVAEMGTPVKLTVNPKTAGVELGSKISASFRLIDANGVGCDALKKGIDVAVSGYGVREVVNGYENRGAKIDSDDNSIYIYTKNDDKYAGSEIKIIATDSRYNLVGENILFISAGTAKLVWMTKEAKINTPTDLTYMTMENGKLMSIGTGSVVSNTPDARKAANTGDIVVAGGQSSFVVVAKPEGATVNFDARAAGGAAASNLGDGYAVGRITCDKPGVVTAKIGMGVEIKQENGTWAAHYYEGTQNIVFTDGSAGKTVVMSIGSSEIVIDGDKAVIDAAPVVQNSRTYVPFRALAEAFGAEVAYDEATQAVTAQLGNTTVVMTIGSATYTVNGEEKTADVAPFISGSRTMVPVRFAAEAFGSTVIPTYDDNGATADVLFKL